VLEADIEAFFDHVSHRKLLKMLRDQIVDPRILNLIQWILQAGFQELGKPWHPTPEGTPQGGPLSPLLANIYLHYGLDLKFQQTTKSHSLRCKLVRFADDFIVLSQTKSDLLKMSRHLKRWMSEAKLTLKESKTKTVDMRNKARGHGSHFDFLGFKIHLRAFQDNPKRFWIARQPSEKARKNLRENLKAKLRPNLSPGEAKNMAKSVWTGWSNYFRFGNSNRVFYREMHSVEHIVYRYLRMKYRNQRRPVPWRRLRPLAKWINKSICPPRLILDLTKQMRAQSAWAF
jgi:group II intron reverse transcriptase/maturase